MYDNLVSLKSVLSSLAKTCLIGHEKGIGAKDSPFIRIVPVKRDNDGSRCVVFLDILFGFDIKNKETEKLNEQLLDMDATISKKLIDNGVEHISTMYDADSVPNLKVGVINCKMRSGCI